MVFCCRCFSFLLEDNDETEYETITQSKSTATGTYYTAGSDFNPSVPNSHAKSAEISNLARKRSNLRVFTVPELMAATNNFCRTSKIGVGRFGSVYKGVIKSLEHPFHEIQVAVKIADDLLKGHKERVSEINLFGTIEHPNLVKLIGYCVKNDKRKYGTQVYFIFVYEYMANRSVRHHLSSTSETPMSWNMRLKVAQDVARVLTYLHEEMEYQMIFLNFNSYNVLLDDQWNTKLSDFGVAQILGPDEKKITDISIKTRPVMHVGYAAPEFVVIGHLTSKVDVWSYGVLLYELITGRHPVDQNLSYEDRYLVEWVKPFIGSKRFKEIIDPRLEGNYSLKSAQKLSDLANKCLSENPKSRPKMSEALEMVNQLITVPSQATSPASPQVPQVDPKKAFDGPTHGEKTNEDIQPKKAACLPKIRHSKFLKSCSKKGCCVSVH